MYAKSRTPSHDDQESAAETIAHLIEQAKEIAQQHVHGDARNSKAWGGNFINALQSAWLIVTSFTQRISGWIAQQTASGNEPTPAAIQTEIDIVTGHVGDFEIHAAIESEVLRELTFAGVKKAKIVAQPDACDDCKARAEAGAQPIDDVEPPPFHGGCRCGVIPADDERIARAAPRMVSKQGSCDCEICRGMAGKPIGEQKPPYHAGCTCEVAEESEKK